MYIAILCCVGAGLLDCLFLAFIVGKTNPYSHVKIPIA